MTHDRLAELERRLHQLEDERAIERLIACYRPLVDVGEADAAAGLWATDRAYDVEGWSMGSRDDVAEMVRSDAHQGLIARGSAHFPGPAVVSVDGGNAAAVCKSLLVLRRDDGYIVSGAGGNHFRLWRIEGRWQILAPFTRPLDGRAEARELLAAGVAGRTR
ncbi:hypothetical protein JMUB5695_01242 [Mycobacterium heckeshornense]|uniref:nuclear transport factor 2 family protein n=1 Tax=Mycobacterium heckeshornense TaxID=110505 RepID=UPI001945B056|nr:nuclear transport factor 2 family protein [Mycobacterium heckeshornense]BCQ07819.1 hypothetical protein JMUB5695_01242 [Mycobacterium heckeshornense]